MKLIETSFNDTIVIPSVGMTPDTVIVEEGGYRAEVNTFTKIPALDSPIHENFSGRLERPGSIIEKIVYHNIGSRDFATEIPCDFEAFELDHGTLLVKCFRASNYIYEVIAELEGIELDILQQGTQQIQDSPLNNLSPASRDQLEAMGNRYVSKKFVLGFYRRGIHIAEMEDFHLIVNLNHYIPESMFGTTQIMDAQIVKRTPKVKDRLHKYSVIHVNLFPSKQTTPAYQGIKFKEETVARPIPDDDKGFFCRIPGLASRYVWIRKLRADEAEKARKRLNAQRMAERAEALLAG
jgi:hypothetical protein